MCESCEKLLFNLLWQTSCFQSHIYHCLQIYKFIFNIHTISYIIYILRGI